MIQRIQSVYLLIAGLYEGMILSGVLSFLIIFIFKNRKLQFVLGRINILLNLILLSVFVYLSLTLPGE